MSQPNVANLEDMVLDEARRILEAVLSKDTFSATQLSLLSLGEVSVRDLAEQLIERAAEVTKKTPDDY